MSSPDQPPGDSGDARPLVGIGLYLIAGAMFTSMDATAKELSATLPVMMIVWGRYFFHFVIMLALFPGKRAKRLIKAKRPAALAVRGSLLLACTFLFFTAISMIPLADANAIGFASPLFVVALSIPLLGERVGIRRWSAVLVGFVGILIIIRPGFAEVHWAYLLILGVAFMFAVYAIMTRRLAADEDPVAMLFYTALVGVIGSSIAVVFHWQWPTPGQWPWMILIGIVGGVSHMLVIYAYRAASASLLAPFQYVMIIWATGFGWLLFGDFPDAWTIFGALIVVVAGTYVFLREAQLSKVSNASIDVLK
ncbi:MAG: DMT family transporter [Rhodospirillaceae bacterium]|jgi:drug/metabolite transporter (DMT)-like permease|nr:DMT family transporter [Rhodospirillaceae bacterium]MBT6136569.1 DMT family transporter [Rhodospirillaceae bacterium]